LFFATPSSLSFGLLRAGASASRSIRLSDAGGLGTWGVHVRLQVPADGASVTVPSSVNIPGQLDIRAAASSDATEQDVTGFLVLSRDADSRRIPFWFRVERPRLGPPTATLVRTGDYKGSTRGKPSRVSSYRYPDNPHGVGIATTLPGPEQVFRVDI